MKKLLIGLTLLLPIIGIGQVKFSEDFTVELSRPFDVVDAAFKEYFPVNNGTQVLSVKASNEGVMLQLFDVNGMRELGRSETKDFQKYAKFIDIIYVNDDNFFFIYEVFHKEERTFSVYKRKITIEDLSIGKAEKLFTTSRTVGTSLGNGYLFTDMPKFNWLGLPIKRKFYVNQSFDKSKIMISYRLKPLNLKDVDNKDVLGMFVYDQGMERLWGKEIKMPYSEAVMNNLAYGVGNRGYGLLMIRKNDTKKYELLGFSDEDNYSLDLDIETDLMFQKFEVREDEEGNFLFSGMYANGIDVKVRWANGDVSTHFNTDGVYLFTLDKDGGMVSKSKIPFELDFIGQYLTDKQRKRLAKREAEGKAGIRDLRIGDVHINKDGSKIIICERQWFETITTGTSKTRVFSYTNMVAMKIDKDGSLLWIKKLPKRQEGATGQGGMGYKYIHGEETHYLVYLDNPKNASLDLESVPYIHKDGKGGYLTAYAISDEDGEVTRHTLFEVKDVDGVKIYQFKVSRVFEVVEGQFLTEVYLKGKKDGMIKMKLR